MTVCTVPWSTLMPFLSMMYLYLQWSVFCFLMSSVSSRILPSLALSPAWSCLTVSRGSQGQRRGERSLPRERISVVRGGQQQDLGLDMARSIKSYM